MPEYRGSTLGTDRPDAPPQVRPVISPPTVPPQRSPGAAGAPLPTGGGPSVPAAQAIVLPPHFFPPAKGSTPVYPFGAQPAVAGPNAQWTVPAGCILAVPANYVAVIRSIGLAYLNSLATTAITLQLRVNAAVQAPVRQLPAIPLAYISDSWDDVAYLVAGPATIDLLVTVIDGGTYAITAWGSGWIMTQQAWNTGGV